MIYLVAILWHLSKCHHHKLLDSPTFDPITSYGYCNVTFFVDMSFKNLTSMKMNTTTTTLIINGSI